MADSIFWRIQKILEKPKPPAYIRTYESPWRQRIWDSIRPPTGVLSGGEPLGRRQRRKWVGGLAVIAMATVAWSVNEYVSNAPQRAQQAYQTAIALEVKGNAGDAVAKFTESLSAGETAEAYLRRGNAYRDLGQTDKAIADWNHAIVLDPQSAGAYAARGMHYASIGNTAKALQDLDESLQIEATLDSYVLRGQVYSGLGQYQKAIEDFDLAIAQDPKAPAAYLARSNAKWALGDDLGAREDRKIVSKLEGR